MADSAEGEVEHLKQRSKDEHAKPAKIVEHEDQDDQQHEPAKQIEHEHQAERTSQRPASVDQDELDKHNEGELASERPASSNVEHDVDQEEHLDHIEHVEQYW